jgi:hypothetical protein
MGQNLDGKWDKILDEKWDKTSMENGTNLGWKMGQNLDSKWDKVYDHAQKKYHAVQPA